MRGGLGVRAQRVRGASARDVGTTARSGRQGKNSSGYRILIVFFSIFLIEVVQGFYNKVVDHALLYNFYKGHRVFFSTNCAQ
jgi:hypothetical protein